MQWKTFGWQPTGSALHVQKTKCTSRTKDQVNGVNLRFASNQKIIESYKDVNKYLHSLHLLWISLIYIYISFPFCFFFFVVYIVVKLNICVGVSFLSDMGVVNFFFSFFFGFLFFLYEKFLLSFMLIIIQKKKKN